MSNPRKIAKLMTAGSLFAVAAFVLANQSLSVTSEDAVINARILTVRAPIEGIVEMPRLQVGQIVKAGQGLGEITNARADEGRVRDLERTATSLALEIEALKAKAADIDVARTRLAGQSIAYRETRLQQSSALIAEAGAALAASRAVAEESAATYRRVKVLADDGWQSRAAVDKAFSIKERDAHTAAAAERRLETLKIELEAARRGVFVNDTIDVDWSRQQDQELGLRKQELAADIADRRLRLDSIRTQLAAEKTSYAAQRETTVASPAAGRLWRLPVGSGEYVNKGQDLAQIVDCGSVMIVAGVGERDFNTLRVGGAASFRPLGSSTLYEATIVRLAGTAGGRADADMAIPATFEHAKRYDVTLSVPELKRDPELGCAVGRTGKVVFKAGIESAFFAAAAASDRETAIVRIPAAGAAPKIAKGSVP